MPQNITDVSTFTAPIVAPQDGDAETAGSVLSGLQGLSNRTAYLNSILATTGATLLRTGSAATMAALVMTAGMAGQIFYVSGRGLFEYKNVSALAVDSNWVYTAAGAASGQWVHALYTSLNANLGIPVIGPIANTGLPSANRISQTIVPYGVQGTYYNGALVMSTSSLSLVALTATPTISLGSLLAGDIVEVVAPAMYACNSLVVAYASVSENGYGYFAATPALQMTASGASLFAPISLGFMRTVSTSGAYNVQFWGSTSNGADPLTVFTQSIYARVFRP